MSLAKKIQKDLVDAMRAKEELRLSVLRGIKAAIKHKEVEKIRTLDEPECVQILQTLVKQRKESIDQFTKGNRPELAEVGTHLLRSAVLAGVLNAVLDEKVNVVNAPAVAAARGLTVEEETRRREHGFPNTLEVSALPEKTGSAPGFTAEGTVLHDGSPRVLQIDGIPLEAELEGTILYLRNRDEPGVIGQIGMTLGKLGVNIATFALGRREAQRGADAVSLVRLDGEAPVSILVPIRAISAITEAKLVRLG